MTQFLLLAVVSTLSSAIIPVTFPPWVMPRVGELSRIGGLPVIDAGYRFGQLHPHVVFLGIDGETVIPEDQIIDVPLNLDVRIPTINNGPMIEIPDARHQWPIPLVGPRSSIGIGPGSDLMRVGRSIDFVRQSTSGGFLRLGGSEDNFVANDCLPDSIMRMATVMGLSPPRRTDSAVRSRAETRVAVSIGDNVITTDSVTILDDWRGFLLALPHTWIANIYAELEAYIDRFQYRTFLTDCANNIHRLPAITLTFTAGGLRLLPEDYTRPTDDQDDFCELLIGAIAVGDTDQSVRFNPLMIPGVNARITQNEIILCDSAIDV